MKIVAITACTAGIAHTYLAKEKLLNAAKELGHQCKVETQGSIGVEDELTAQEIAEADVVILATDIRVSKDRFKDKPIVEIPVGLVVKSPKGVISQIASKLGK